MAVAAAALRDAMLRLTAAGGDAAPSPAQAASASTTSTTRLVVLVAILVAVAAVWFVLRLR
ncbi:MAG: hypothetical protein QM736_24460 [Vicinamibacterales bacterium]